MSTLIPSDLTATLVFVRHGESTWIARNLFQGQRNPWLSERGRAEADAVARRLGDPLAPPPLPVPAGRPVAIWHSPLKRAADTARAIGRLVPVPLVSDPRLAEMAQGEWEGRSQRQVAAMGPRLEAWRRDPVRNSAPGGESLIAARPRVRAVLTDILADLSSAAARPGVSTPWAVVVSHGGTMRLALLQLLERPLADFWEFPFAPGGFSIVEVKVGRATLRAHNLMGHLDDGTPDAAGPGAVAL